MGSIRFAFRDWFAPKQDTFGRDLMFYNRDLVKIVRMAFRQLMAAYGIDIEYLKYALEEDS